MEMDDVTVDTAQLRLVQALGELQRAPAEGHRQAADPLLALYLGLDLARDMDPSTDGPCHLGSVFAAFEDLVLAVRSDPAPQEIGSA